MKVCKSILEYDPKYRYAPENEHNKRSSIKVAVLVS